MFTEEHILENLDAILKLRDKSIRLEYHDHEKFKGGGEDNLIVASCEVGTFKKLSEFWVSSLNSAYKQMEGFYPEPIDFIGHCSECTVQGLNKEISVWNQKLYHPIDLSFNPTKIYQIKNEWSDQAFIIITEDKWICLYWWTTA